MPQALIVDDEQHLVLIAIELFEEAGFTTISAYSADDARLILDKRGNEVDLLFTDVRLPGAMDGLALAHFASTQWPNMGILIASAVKPASDDIPAGAAFVSKPYSVEDLLVRLERVMSCEGAKGHGGAQAHD